MSHPALLIGLTVAERAGVGVKTGDEGEQDRGEHTSRWVDMLTCSSFPSRTAPRIENVSPISRGVSLV